jgi:hypothetical protein
LDSLVRIEPFQRVAPTPQGKKSSSPSFPNRWPRPGRASFRELAKDTTISDFRKGIFLNFLAQGRGCWVLVFVANNAKPEVQRHHAALEEPVRPTY